MKLKDLKKHYLQYGVYIHPCNNSDCGKWSQALHLAKCILCEQNNNCFDLEIAKQVTDDIADEVAMKIIEIYQE